jgi:hypothetical protein
MPWCYLLFDYLQFTIWGSPKLGKNKTRQVFSFIGLLKMPEINRIVNLLQTLVYEFSCMIKQK